MTSEMWQILCALLGGLSGGGAAGYFSYIKDMKLRNKEKQEKQAAYRSSIRLIIDDLEKEHEKNFECNIQAFTKLDNDLLNIPVPGFMEAFKETSIPDRFKPEHWHEQSLLGKAGAENLYRLNILLAESNNYISKVSWRDDRSKYTKLTEEIKILLKEIRKDLEQ